MLHYARMTTALRALGALFIIAGVLAASHQAQAASRSGTAGGGLTVSPGVDGTAHTTASPAATRTVNATGTTVAETTTPEPTATPVPTDTPTNTPTNTPTSTNTPGAPLTHTPTTTSSTETPGETPTVAQSTASPVSTVLSAGQPPASSGSGVVLPATGSSVDSGPGAVQWIAAAGMVVAGFTLLFATLLWRDRREQ